MDQSELDGLNTITQFTRAPMPQDIPIFDDGYIALLTDETEAVEPWHEHCILTSPFGTPLRQFCGPTESLSKEIGADCDSTVTNLNQLNTEMPPILTLSSSVKPSLSSTMPPFNEYSQIFPVPHQQSSVFNHSSMITVLPFPYDGVQRTNFISQNSNTTHRSGSIREANSPFNAQKVADDEHKDTKEKRTETDKENVMFLAYSHSQTEMKLPGSSLCHPQNFNKHPMYVSGEHERVNEEAVVHQNGGHNNIPYILHIKPDNINHFHHGAPYSASTLETKIPSQMDGKPPGFSTINSSNTMNKLVTDEQIVCKSDSGQNIPSHALHGNTWRNGPFPNSRSMHGDESSHEHGVNTSMSLEVEEMVDLLSNQASTMYAREDSVITSTPTMTMTQSSTSISPKATTLKMMPKITRTPTMISTMTSTMNQNPSLMPTPIQIRVQNVTPSSKLTPLMSGERKKYYSKDGILDGTDHKPFSVRAAMKRQCVGQLKPRGMKKSRPVVSVPSGNDNNHESSSSNMKSSSNSSFLTHFPLGRSKMDRINMINETPVLKQKEKKTNLSDTDPVLNSYSFPSSEIHHSIQLPILLPSPPPPVMPTVLPSPTSSAIPNIPITTTSVLPRKTETLQPSSKSTKENGSGNDSRRRQKEIYFTQSPSISKPSQHQNSGIIPSRFCHICTRSTKPNELLVCGNVKKASCRKVICHRCLNDLFIDWNSLKPSENWECTHCRKVSILLFFLMVLPPYSQCFFKKTSSSGQNCPCRIKSSFMTTGLIQR